MSNQTKDIIHAIHQGDYLEDIEASAPRFTLAGSGLSDMEEKMARSLAAHEAGHHLVAEVKGLDPHSWLAGPRHGACVHKNGDPDAVESVSWSGIVAEDLLGVREPGREFPATILGREPNLWDVWNWVSDVREALRRNKPHEAGLSWADQCAINGFNRGPVPVETYRLLAARLGELKELADTIYATWRDAIIQARDLPEDIVRATSGRPDAEVTTCYGQSVARMMPIEKLAGDTERLAEAKSREAEAFSRQLERFGNLAEPDSHLEAALEHVGAMEAFLEAAEAAESFNRGWATEFCKLRASGDVSGARRAAYCVEIRKPRYLKMASSKHADAAVFHRGKSGWAE